MSSRPYEGADDLRRMQELAVEQWRLEGPHVQNHVGDFAWVRFHHTGREAEWLTQLWEEDGRVVAYGWAYRPGVLWHEVHPERRALRDELLDWFEATEQADELHTYVLSTDVAAAAVLRRRGYARNEEAILLAYHSRTLGEEAEPALPEGYRLRTVGAADLEPRVEVHRAAFHPSRVTAESYRNVSAAWPYRPELDCVVEAPDGSFAAFCCAWLDDANRVGELEPVGTHPDHRRLGLATAVCRFACRRLREEGAEQAVVYAWADPANPGPKLLYESLGFVEHARSLDFVRVRRGQTP